MCSRFFVILICGAAMKRNPSVVPGQISPAPISIVLQRGKGIQSVPATLVARADKLIDERFPLLAQSGHLDTLNECPLSRVKRTSLGRGRMSASDPKRT
jgi:hypothetical protein